jgi:Predicted methyltransferase (contains TPR repeat)
MESRVKGKSIEINYNDTLDFFNSRGRVEPLKHKYNYVLFQDEHPELAIERDNYEKNKINGIIDFAKQDSVLDIGCGVGRWGEEVLSRGVRYIGIDYSEQLLDIADENLKQWKDNYTLINSSVQLLLEGLTGVNKLQTYDTIFINGILMYLNDADLATCFDQLGKVINQNKCVIYIKETIAVEERLTLNKFYSKDLKHTYTAIYRTAEEYRNLLIEKLVVPFNFTIDISEDLFPEDLKNRKETKDYFYILKKEVEEL